ncbi:hypothetical protein HPB51_008458 [Rhipicephalus microplus]|uniref:Uncharacterized protein n=1 Tax=Rhipicephalus microplus TaxID=6941 RepID=A0A9J6ERK9_RHIMP|nr:hypothetical protein HPB51_008458 [Rhipicephalus microplus]
MATADGAPPRSVFVRQAVFVFPREQFDPNCVRLVTRSRDPATAVAYMLGFFKLVCEDGYEQVFRASDVDGVWLDEVRVSGAFVRRQLRALGADSEPRATMDDLYVLLGVLLCNMPRARGSNQNRDWFQYRINDLVQLFPGVSEPPPVPLYGEEQADAGPMRLVQKYVSMRWRFAGMKHVELILEYVRGQNSWVLDIIPELRANGDRLQVAHVYIPRGYRKRPESVLCYEEKAEVTLGVDARANGFRVESVLHRFRTSHRASIEISRGCPDRDTTTTPLLNALEDLIAPCAQEFLKAYRRLGADGPYMKLLHLPEAATADRKRLGLHVAAAYAFAVLEDQDWLQYRGVPQDEAEQAVLAKITAIKRMGLGAPPVDATASIAPRDGDDDDPSRGVDVAAAGEPAANTAATRS